MRNLILVISLISFLHCISQENYNFSFNQSDFHITLKSDTAIIQHNANYNYSGSDNTPELPYITKRILNPINEIVTGFDITTTRELLASNVIMRCADADSLGITNVYHDVATPPVTLVSGHSSHHGYSFSTWLIHPIVYDGITKQLYLITNICITPKRTYAPNSSFCFVKPERIDSVQYLNLDVMNSYSILSRIEFDTQDLPPIDYAIITRDSLISSFDELVRWKNMRGVRTSVFSVEDIYRTSPDTLSQREKIKHFLYGLYQNRDLKYCTLGGDNNIIPCVQYPMFRGMINNIEDWEDIASDSYYACFDQGIKWVFSSRAKTRELYGNVRPYNNLDKIISSIDFTHEIAITRIPARTKKDIASFCQKIISYESTPQTSRLNSVLLGGMEIRNYYNNYTSDSNYEGECIKYHLGQVWSGTVEYLFDTENTLGYNDDAFTAQNIYTEFNKGYGFIEINCHGTEILGWPTLAGSYGTSDALQQLNGASSIILSTSCYINQFDSNTDPNLCEAFIRNPNGGALAVIGSTRNGKYITNDYFKLSVRYDSDFLKKTLGNKTQEAHHLALNILQAKEDFLGELFGNNKMNHLYLQWAINIMGDAEMPVYTDIPTEIQPTISRTGNSVTVSVNNLPPDAVITLSDGLVNPNRMERHVGMNNVTFENLVEPYTIVISAHNRIPYIYKPTKYINLHLHDRVIDQDVTYRAQNIVVGENLTIKAGTTLTLISDNEIKMLSNVICESGAKLVFNLSN